MLGRVEITVCKDSSGFAYNNPVICCKFIEVLEKNHSVNSKLKMTVLCRVLSQYWFLMEDALWVVVVGRGVGVLVYLDITIGNGQCKKAK